MLHANLMIRLSHIFEFGKAVTKEAVAIISGDEPVSPELKSNRIRICEACEFFQLRHCLKCNCNMDIKTGLRTAVCPIAKW